MLNNIRQQTGLKYPDPYKITKLKIYVYTMWWVWKDGGLQQVTQQVLKAGNN